MQAVDSRFPVFFGSRFLIVFCPNGLGVGKIDRGGALSAGVIVHCQNSHLLQSKRMKYRLVVEVSINKGIPQEPCGLLDVYGTMDTANIEDAQLQEHSITHVV